MCVCVCIYIYMSYMCVCVCVCVCVCIHMCIIKIKFGEVQLKNTEELNCKIVISPELIVKVILVGFIWRKAILCQKMEITSWSLLKPTGYNCYAKLL